MARSETWTRLSMRGTEVVETEIEIRPGFRGRVPVPVDLVREWLTDAGYVQAADDG